MSECLTPTNCKAKSLVAKSLVAKCGSVSEKFAYLMQTKDLMRKMLISKGQDVPADLPFRDYIEKIAALVPTTDVVTSIIDYKGDTHKGDVTVDKNFIDLSNVDNTADIDKPISTATQEALDLKQNITDDSLETEAKTIVGAINELKALLDNQSAKIAIFEGKTNVSANGEVVLPLMSNSSEIFFEAGTLTDITVTLLVTDNINILNKYSYTFNIGLLGDNHIVSEKVIERLLSYGEATHITFNLLSSDQSVQLQVVNEDDRNYTLLSTTYLQKFASNG